LGNPWLIPQITKYLDTGILDAPPDDIDRLITAYRHCLGLIAYKGQRIGANESRRHLTHYTKGIPRSAPYRARLTQTNGPNEVAVILSELAEQVGGREGQSRFLAAVEQDNLKYGEHPGQGHSHGKGGIQAEVYIQPVLPVAKP
jgi:hypothetical protein